MTFNEFIKRNKLRPTSARRYLSKIPDKVLAPAYNNGKVIDEERLLGMITFWGSFSNIDPLLIAKSLSVSNLTEIDRLPLDCKVLGKNLRTL